MKRTLSILLALLMLCTMIPFSVFAADDPFRVVISLEGFTLGQGYYVEPTSYSLDRINELIKKDGYGPYTEDTLTASMATLAMFNDKGLTATIGYGTWENSGYIETIAGIDNGNINIPAVLTANGGPSNDNYTANTDKDLGENDYTSSSGWMAFINDKSLSKTASAFVLKKDASADYGNTYVIRWQFSLFAYEASLGFVSWDGTSFFTHANKDKAMIAYADSNNSRAKAKAKPVLEKLDATQSEVDATVSPLEKAPTVWDRILDFFDRIVAFFRNLFKR